MDKEKSINTFSIVAFVLSFLLFPVGLILSIIGLVRCKNYKKEEGKYPRYFAFNIERWEYHEYDYAFCE